MYANLEVSIGRLPLRLNAAGDPLYDETVYAWAVHVDGDRASILLDAQDGDGNYAEPAGERVVDLTTHAISIAADF
jgi:hypothetical protein